MKRLFVMLALLLSLALILSCAPKVAPTTPVKPAESIELTFSIWTPSVHPYSFPVEEWYVPEIEKRTQGRLKISVYPGGALGKAGTHYEMVRTGVVDIGLIAATYTPGTFPLLELMGIPFAFPSQLIFTSMQNDLAERGWYDKELGEVVPVNFFCPPPYQFCMGKRTPKILAMEDLKGVKVRTPGGFYTKMIGTLGGAVPVSVPSPEIYTAMDKGVFDICVVPLESLKSKKYGEVTSSVLELNFGIYGSVVNIMNKEVFENLPVDIQFVILGIRRDFGMYQTHRYVERDKVAKEWCLERGIEIYTLPPAEIQKFADAVKPGVYEYVKALDEKGVQGTQFLGEIMSLLEKYGVEAPY